MEKFHYQLMQNLTSVNDITDPLLQCDILNSGQYNNIIEAQTEQKARCLLLKYIIESNSEDAYDVLLKQLEATKQMKLFHMLCECGGLLCNPTYSKL